MPISFSSSLREECRTGQKYLAKGRKILVISHVKTGSYEKDGKRIYTTEFVVDKIEFLSSAQQDNRAQHRQSSPPRAMPIRDSSRSMMTSCPSKNLRR